MDAINNYLLDDIELRSPMVSDGEALNTLLATSVVLDGNPVQCTLLQCGHFARTSVAAFSDGELVGFVSAYCLPDEPETLFVWQVVVAAPLRALGLGKRMLHWLVSQPACAQALRMVTAIGLRNAASWSLFESFAHECGAISVKSFVSQVDRKRSEQEPSEYMLRISPLPRQKEKNISVNAIERKNIISNALMKRYLPV